jgi:UPF0755 protein
VAAEGSSSPPVAAREADQPMTRREAREAEQRRLAAAQAEVLAPATPSRAERRAAASDYDVHDPEKPRRRGPWGCLVGLVIVAALVAGAVFFLQGPINALIERFTPAADYTGSGTGEVVFMIHEGETGSDIAENLVDEGVTASYDAFYDLLLEQTPEPEFHPGAYRLAEEMSAQAALDALTEPANKLENTFVIPEGTALADVLIAASEGTGIPIEELQAAAAEPPANYGLPAEATSLEGFLFPATYELKKGQRVARLRELQLANFKRNFSKVDLGYAKRKNLNAYDVLVIASLIEREAMVAKERPLIASVIYNRLHDDIRLDIDATTRFAVGNWKRPLKVSELQNPSPYNTRVHPGLPPGPIGNPGLASIRAAAHPATTGYLFYVVKPGTCGKHNFAKTDAEFQGYVNEYNRARDKNGGKSPTTC